MLNTVVYLVYASKPGEAQPAIVLSVHDTPAVLTEDGAVVTPPAVTAVTTVNRGAGLAPVTETVVPHVSVAQGASVAWARPEEVNAAVLPANYLAPHEGTGKAIVDGGTTDLGATGQG